MPFGPGVAPLQHDSARRTRTLTRMYDHLVRVLYNTNVFDEIEQTIQVRATSRFIPQFIQELHPYLVENTPKGPFRHVFTDHGIFKPTDIEQIAQEWSQNYSTMTK